MNGLENEISMHEKAAGIISEYTGISQEKVKFFIDSMGLRAVLENPSLICTDDSQIEKLDELHAILERAVKNSETVSD